jgi:hypothetical protein
VSKRTQTRIVEYNSQTEMNISKNINYFNVSNNIHLIGGKL